MLTFNWDNENSPPAVLSLRPHLSHLKCLAFWWEMRIFRSSKSRSPVARSVKICCLGWEGIATYSNSTKVEQVAPRRRDDRASSCRPLCRWMAMRKNWWKKMLLNWIEAEFEEMEIFEARNRNRARRWLSCEIAATPEAIFTSSSANWLEQ